MTNYPEGFKGTNMDARACERADGAIEWMASLPEQIAKLIADGSHQHRIYLTQPDVKDFLDVLKERLGDLFFAEHNRLTALAGINPKYLEVFASQAERDAWEDLARSAKPQTARPINPATPGVKEQL